MSILNFLAPLKTKFPRANDANFVTKELTKAIMLRLKLHNKYLMKILVMRIYYTKNKTTFLFSK